MLESATLQLGTLASLANLNKINSSLNLASISQTIPFRKIINTSETLILEAQESRKLIIIQNIGITSIYLGFGSAEIGDNKGGILLFPGGLLSADRETFLQLPLKALSLNQNGLIVGTEGF